MLIAFLTKSRINNNHLCLTEYYICFLRVYNTILQSICIKTIHNLLLLLLFSIIIPRNTIWSHYKSKHVFTDNYFNIVLNTLMSFFYVKYHLNIPNYSIQKIKRTYFLLENIF